MFFALTNAIFEARIVAWDAKRAFDSAQERSDDISARISGNG